MIALRTILVLCAAAMIAAPSVFAATISLTPIKDNTLYENATGATSNGAGQHMFCGRDNSGRIKRCVLAFDIAGNLPSGAIINNAELKLVMSKTTAPAQTISVHRLTADWGEGTSDAAANEGGGAAATAGDATWLHTFAPGLLWGSPGGDFVAVATATQSVVGPATYTWTSAQLIAEVQDMLDGPAGNFGWVLIGNEATVHTTKRFNTREHPTASSHPVLDIDFTPLAHVEYENPSQTWGEIKDLYR